jgi:hypothetical protein
MTGLTTAFAMFAAVVGFQSGIGGRAPEATGTKKQGRRLLS